MYGIIGNLVFVAAVIYALITMSNINKSGQMDGPLTSQERIIVTLTTIFSPVIAGAIYYYGLKSAYPIKAKRANTISITVFLIEFLIFIGVIFYSVYVLKKF